MSSASLCRNVFETRYVIHPLLRGSVVQCDNHLPHFPHFAVSALTERLVK